MAAIITYQANSSIYQDKTVAEILKKEFSMSTSVLRGLKQNNKIFLNNNPCRTVDKVKKGDYICADVTEHISENSNISPFKGEADILYEDDFLIAVNKPANMESHPCPSNRQSTLANILMYYWAKNGEQHNYHIVTRLDKGTSGVCIIAKNQYTHGCLAEQIKKGTLIKKYIAVVHGSLNKKSGDVILPIGRTDESIIKRQICKDGKYAKTMYKVLQENGKYSLIDVSIETGRTHQIRVHFSAIGHPLVGDWLYGNGDNEKDIISRHALHAKEIKFCHPVTKEIIVISAKVPNDIEKLINL